MIRKKRWIWVLLGLTGIFVIAAGAAAIFAQEPAADTLDRGEESAPLLESPRQSRREALRSWHQRAHRRPQPLERFLKYGVDQDQLLADALGISVEELQEARQDARAAAIFQAVELGIITQEEGDSILAFMALQASISREELVAEALDIDVEELREAREEGKRLPALLEQQDQTVLDFRNNLLAAFQNTIEEAAANGVISQEQANLILNEPDLALRRLFPNFALPLPAHE